MSVQTDVSTRADIQAVQAGFAAVATGDLVAFAECFHPDATWNHRNPDRLGGVKHGIEAIVGFLGTSMELTAGTLRPVPELYLSDGAGHVAVITRISGSRPDGRTFDDTQIMNFILDGEKVHAVDQFIGDPTAVTEFWA
jgi:ketosteroid isomerase-like protein